MADTTTSNLLLTKPEVGASTDTWGSKINTDLDSVDAVFAAAGTGTSVGLNVGSGKTLKVAGTTDFSANLTFTGTGNRITGDFSNATHANRVAFQSSTTNGSTTPFFIPNGTGNTAGIVVASASDPTNCSFGQLVVGTTSVAVVSSILGTGTYLPMTFSTGGSESLRLSATTKAVILAGGSTSANGTGITFPATQSASSDANTLDDYEEGTWTPVLENTGAGAYSLQDGAYVKVGKSVICTGVIVKGSGTLTGTVAVTNLPFTSNNTYGSAAADSAGGFAVDSGRKDPSNTKFSLKLNGAEISSGTNSWNITFSVSYITA
jgi:hypothetical protein